MKEGRKMEMIRKILAETFSIRESDLTENTEMTEIESWDSLTHMEMISNLESELEIEFTADEIMEMTNVGKIEKIVGEKLSGN